MPKNKIFIIKGFTLIELMIVIAIIAILVTIGGSNYINSLSRGRDAQRKSDIKSVETALRLYYNDKGTFPASDSGNQILGCGAMGSTLCNWGDPWTAGSATYMNKLPKDQSGRTYYYLRNDPDSYTLRACLEVTTDSGGKAVTGSGWVCPSGWMFEVTGS